MESTPTSAPTSSPLFKWLALALLLFTLVAVVLLVGTLFLFVNLFNDSGAPESKLLLPTLIFSAPFLVIFLPCWITGLVLYLKKKYRGSAIALGILIVLFAGLWLSGKLLGAQQRHATAVANTRRDTPAPGFFIPTTAIIPAGFTQLRQEYFNGAYVVEYKDYSAGSADLMFSENGDTRIGYAFQVRTEDNIQGGTGPLSAREIQDFTFNGAPGRIYISDTRGTGPALENYLLIWNDNGKALEIRLIHVPKGKYSAQALIDMLKGMAKS